MSDQLVYRPPDPSVANSFLAYKYAEAYRICNESWVVNLEKNLNKRRWWMCFKKEKEDYKEKIANQIDSYAGKLYELESHVNRINNELQVLKLITNNINYQLVQSPSDFEAREKLKKEGFEFIGEVLIKDAWDLKKEVWVKR